MNLRVNDRRTDKPYQLNDFVVTTEGDYSSAAEAYWAEYNAWHDKHGAAWARHQAWQRQEARASGLPSTDQIRGHLRTFDPVLDGMALAAASPFLLYGAEAVAAIQVSEKTKSIASLVTSYASEGQRSQSTFS